MTGNPAATIWQLATAAVASRALQVAAELGVADHMDDEPVDAERLAKSCEVQPEALDRLLRLLCAHGVFVRGTEGYRHNDASRLLRSDHPASMRAFPRMMGLPVFTASFGHLDHAIRTGAPALERVHPQGLWDHLQGSPQDAAVFGAAMTAKAQADVGCVLASYDLTRFRRIADIGGGRGHLLKAVLEAQPECEGILFDLPSVIDTVDATSRPFRTCPGDFFVDPLPVADLYVLMEVLHDWPDAQALAILSAVRRAAPDGATLVVIEAVVADGHPDPRVHTLDVIMLGITGGRERSPAELDELFRASGWRGSAVVATPGPIRVVEAVTAGR